MSGLQVCEENKGISHRHWCVGRFPEHSTAEGKSRPLKGIYGIKHRPN